MAPRAEAPPARYDARMRVSLVTVALSGGVLAFCALAFLGAPAAFSVAIGAGLATGNLWALARIVAELLPDERSGRQDARGGGARNTGPWAVVALLKMFALLATAWLLMRHGVASPAPMLVGFGSLPIGIAIGSLVSDRGAAHDDSHDPRHDHRHDRR
jgi:hypothetical protein